MKKGPFKMKSMSFKGSTAKKDKKIKELKGTTIFGKEVSRIKEAARTGVGQFAKLLKK